MNGSLARAAEARPGISWNPIAQATLMTLLAGFVDAVGYAALGHLYLSFMSGNSTQLGMALAHGDRHVILWAGAIIAIFVLGGFLGALLASAGRKAMRVLAAELLCFLAAWGLDGILPGPSALLLIGLAMGMQNAIHRSIAGAATGRSFVTGALYGLGDALARAWLGKARLAEAGAYGLSWLGFIAGVAAGAVAYGVLGVGPALLGGAGMVLILIVLSSLEVEAPQAGAR